MATVQAAGHTFIDGVCSCGRRREHLRGVTRSHVGMNGIAHQGALNEKEADECIELDAKEARAVEIAMGWVKPTPIRTSDELDSALRHGSPLRMAPDAGFYKNDGYYLGPARPMHMGWLPG
jgi:hypothetical protein